MLVVLLPGTLASCAIAPKDQALSSYVPAPEAWQGVASTEAFKANWLADFADTQLDALVDEALTGNFDLQRTASRVQSFQAQRRAANASRWPQLSASFEAARSQQQIAGVTSKGDDYSLQATLGWELDIWQRLGNRTRAAVLDVESAQADLAAARLSLAANVARGW